MAGLPKENITQLKIPSVAGALLVAVLVACTILDADAQILHVCKIQGTVKYDKNLLKTGDQIALENTTALEFSAPTDFVVVISTEKGRCVISPSNPNAPSKATETSDHHLWVFVKDNLVPCPKMNSLFSRGSEDDIRDYLGNGRWVILDSLNIPLSAKYFEVDLSLMITYTLNGQRIEKKSFLRETYPYLVINRETFTTNQQYWDPSEVTDLALTLRDEYLNLTRTLSDLTLISLRNASVLAELQAAYQGLRGYTPDAQKINEEMKAQIEQYYGHIDTATLKSFIEVLN